jgi:type I restriction enzyme, S subunit
MSERPNGWTRCTIGSLCDLINGRAFKPTDWSESGLPIVRIKNLNDAEAPFNRFDGEVRDRFLIDSGALLFAWSGTPGTSFGSHIWSGGPAVLNQHIFHVIFDEAKVDKQFFQLAINQKLGELIDKAHGGVGLRHVTKGKFETTQIDLPPLDEQWRIVGKVTDLLSRSRRAARELARISDLVTRYKNAVLAAAFSGELTQNWRKQKGFSRPKSVTLDSLVAVPIRNGLSVRGSDDPPGVRSLRLSALHGHVVDLSDVRFLPITKSDAERFFLREGDVLVSRGNGTKSFVGIAALVPKVTQPTIFPDTAFRIRLATERARPEWFTSIWNAPQVRTQIENAAKTTAGIWKVSQGDLSQIKLLLPSPEEQDEMSRRVEAAFARIETLAAEASRATDLLDRLEQATLEKAFRGELVSQETDQSTGPVPSPYDAHVVASSLTGTTRSHHGGGKSANGTPASARRKGKVSASRRGRS